MDLPSWSDLVNQGEVAATKAFDQAKPALEAGLEQWGATVLQNQADASKKELQTQVQNISQTKSDPGSLGAAFSSVFSDVSLKTYGPMISLAAVALVVVGVMLAD